MERVRARASRSQSDGFHDRIPRPLWGQDALLEVDRVDGVRPEQVARLGFEDPPDAVEIAPALHARQRDVRLPRAAFSRKPRGSKAGPQESGILAVGSAPPNPNPVTVHPPRLGERAG